MIAARLHRTSSIVVFLVLVLAPAAVSAGPSPERRAVSPASSPQALAQRFCGALQALPETRKAACCAGAPSSGLASECVRVLTGALREKAVALDAADVERCVAASERQLDGCAWVTPYAPRVPESCRGILHGRRAVGAACHASLECADGSFCWGSGPTSPGICAPPAAAGATCGGATDPLATYARQSDDGRHPECAGFCARGRCASFLPAGSTCSANEQCGPAAHCADSRCTAGARPGLGEACAGTSCAGDLVCVDGWCAAPKGAGESCTKPLECAATCLPPSGDKKRVCGMQCSAWPPSGYTPAAEASRPPRG